MGASLEAGAFGGTINSQEARVVDAQNRILAATGKNVVIHQYAVSGADTQSMILDQWPAVLAAQGTLPGEGRTLVIMNPGGNDVTARVPITLPNQHLTNQRVALQDLIAEIESKGWDWVLPELSWRDYNTPAALVDRTQGSWQWNVAVTKPINAARNKLWGRNGVHADGTSWWDTYSLVRNNRDMLAAPDAIHFNDNGYTKFRNYIVDSAIVPAITGIAPSQIFLRDETSTVPLTHTINGVTGVGTTLEVTTTSSYQGTTHIGVYENGSTPTASDVLNGTGAGFVKKIAPTRLGNLDAPVTTVVDGLAGSTTYAVRSVLVSDTNATSAMQSASGTTGVYVAPTLEQQTAEIFAKYNAAGARTIWYDLSDKATLFQDADGTVPVTASGQPIARVADKSAGSTLHYAVQATAESRPLYVEDSGLAFALFDGVNDFWQTGVNVNLSGGVSKLSVLAGVRKASDAARGVVAEHSPSISGDSGTFMLNAPNSAGDNAAFLSRGNNIVTVTASGLPAPASLVLNGTADLLASLTELRVNGTSRATSTSASGGTSFVSRVTYIGARAGTSLRFNGRMHQFLLIGALLTEDERTILESYIAAKSGVTL